MTQNLPLISLRYTQFGKNSMTSLSHYWCTQTFFAVVSLGIALAIIGFLMSTIGVIVTNSFLWNAPKHILIGVSTLLGFGFYLYSLLKLRSLVQGILLSKKRSIPCGTKSKSNYKEKKSSLALEQESCSNAAIERSVLKADRHEFKVDKVVSPIEEFYNKSSFVKFVKFGNTELNEASVLSTPSKTRMQLSEVGRTRDSPRRKQTFTNPTRTSSRSTVRHERASKTVQRLNVLLLIGSLLALPVAILFISLAFIQFSWEQTYEEQNQAENNNWDVFTDLGYWIALIVTSYFQYYTSGGGW